jgi:hypothetical protein
MTKKRREIPQRKAWGLSRKQLVTFSLVCVVAIAIGSTILFFLQQPPNNDHFSFKAAIIDQLSGEFPNPTFVNNVNASLTEYGFSVSYYDKPDVEFFRGLAKNNYGIIVLRVHSAMRIDNSTVDFFTSEPFNTQEHVQERDEGLVVKGILNYSGTEKTFFAITPGFVEKLEGKFPKSVIIAMGCWSLKDGLEQMANAFTGKGAKAYVGWSGLVEPSNVSNETAKLISRLLVEDKTLEKAANETPHDPDFIYSSLGYYPESAGSLRLSDLINEAKDSGTSLNPAISNYCCNLALAVVYYSHKKSKDLK